LFHVGAESITWPCSPAGQARRGQGGGARAGDREVPAWRPGERGSHLEVDL